MKNTTPLILFDVDGTLIDNHDEPRWPVIDMLRTFAQLGWRVGVWSGGGVDYASHVVKQLGIGRFLDVVLAKGPIDHPQYQPTIAVDDVEDADFGPDCFVLVV